MTRAERLHNLLEEINIKKAHNLLKIWSEIFDTSNIFEIYDRLIYVKKEIDAFDEELQLLNLDNEQFKTTIYALNTIIKSSSLASSMSNYDFFRSPKLELIFSTFDTLKLFEQRNYISLEKEEDIPTDEFISFKRNIDNIINEIEKSNMLKADKLIFLSIFHDLSKGFSLYKINGLDAFVEVLRNNFCKIKMISELEDNVDSIKLKTLMKKTVGQIWVWTVKYTKKKTLGLLESKFTKVLDENLSEWAELPLADSQDIENLEEKK
jgi:hypothetical protein